MNTNKTALITGSSGFLGKHLLKTLKNSGYKTLRISHEFLRLQSDIHRFFDSAPVFDYIFHLSAYGNMGNHSNDEEIIESNILGTWNLLQATKDIPYKAFINVSSSSVTLPHQTIYSATKLGAEALCRAFVDEYQKPIVTVRPYSVYGPEEADFRFIPTVFRSCMTGEPMTLAPGTHDWIYIDDVIRVLIEYVDNIDKLMGATGELGTGIMTSNKSLVKMIEGITGRKANITEKKQLRSFDNDNWVSNSTIGAALFLDQGLKKYYEWYTNNRKEDN